jgi:hypothetical protein
MNSEMKSPVLIIGSCPVRRSTVRNWQSSERLTFFSTARDHHEASPGG